MTQFNGFYEHPGVPMTPSPALIAPSNYRPGAPEPLARVAPLGPSCLVARRPRLGPGLRPAQAADGIVELRELAQHSWAALSLRWSMGKPALATPMRPRREAKPVDEMTLADLEATQNDELPSISHEAWEELGTKALSLDASAKFDDEPEAGTIAERIGAEAVGLMLAEVDHVDPVWADAIEDARINLGDDAPKADLHAYAQQLVNEQLDALRSKIAYRYGTPIETLTPQQRDRIDWERYVAQCSGITRHEGFRLLPNDVRFFSFPVVKGEAFLARKRAHIADFLARIGREVFPSPAEFAQRRNVLRALAKQYRWRENAKRLDQQIDELERERSWLLDRTGAMSWDSDEWDWTPAYATLRERAWRERKPSGWVQPEVYAALRAEAREVAFTQWQELRADAQRRPVHHCRNTRTHGSRDEMWHAVPRPAGEFAIGFLDDGFRYAKRTLRPGAKPLKPLNIQRKPVSVRERMRIEASAKRAVERFAVHAFRLGQKAYVFHA